MTRPDAASAELLTSRELRFLDLISQGFSNAMIADVMDVSAGTVKDLAGIVYRKLGARDRANATLIGTTAHWSQRAYLPLPTHCKQIGLRKMSFGAVHPTSGNGACVCSTQMLCASVHNVALNPGFTFASMSLARPESHGIALPAQMRTRIACEPSTET